MLAPLLLVAVVVVVIVTGVLIFTSARPHSSALHERTDTQNGKKRRRQHAAEPDSLARRIQEVRKEIARQVSLASVHQLAGWLLTFGQFIVGGLLASSFLQQALSKELVGTLGLFVLASSLVRQHYKHEFRSSLAKSRAAKLRNAVRQVEDQLELKRSGDMHAARPEELRSLLRSILAEVEVTGAITSMPNSQAPSIREHPNVPPNVSR
jgi:hypothetical protein